MPALVTLTDAKLRCRIFIADDDTDLNRMIAEASAAVIARVDNPTVTDLWIDPTTTPDEARAAILEVVQFLYERDPALNQIDDQHRGLLPARAERLLYRLTKPALA